MCSVQGVHSAKLTETAGPIIDFPVKSWDFGEIMSGEFPTHSFILRNRGDEALIIRNFETDCESCMDVRISKTSILPGNSAELKIRINVPEMEKRFFHRIYIKTNDPGHPQVIAAVSGIIKDVRESDAGKKNDVVSHDLRSENKNSFTLGVSYFGKGEYEKAIPEFEKSIQSKPEHTDSYYYLGQCYLQMGIREYNRKHIFKAYGLYRKANKVAEEVIPLYEKAIEQNPNDLNALMKLGYIYEVKSFVPYINEYEAALRYYLAAVELKTVTPERNRSIYIFLHFRIGVIYFHEKDYMRAISYLEKALETLSIQDDAEIYYYLGMSYDKINEKEKALDLLIKVIEIAPQSEFAREAQEKIERLK